MFWNNAGLSQRPWGLVSLVTGAYGLVGTGVFVACFLLPLLISLFHAPWLDRSDTARYVHVGVPLLVALHAVDATLNPAFFLPALFLFGAWVGAQRRIEHRRNDEAYWTRWVPRGFLTQPLPVTSAVGSVRRN
jgi:hypothetical protein